LVRLVFERNTMSQEFKSREIKLTKEGFARLQESLAHEQARLEEIERGLQEQSGISDDYDDNTLEAAKNEKREIEKRIFDLEETLARAVMLEEVGDGSSVTLGSIVTIKEEKSGKELQVQLVAPPEAAILGGMRKVSDESPLGKELIGKKQGELFVVNLERGQLKYKVVTIKKA
jgi:transcription elongation factor GreA